MAESDEAIEGIAGTDGPLWRDRSAQEHGQALANLMLYVSAAPRRAKPDALDFPVLKDRLRQSQ